VVPHRPGIICWDLSSIPVGKTVTAVNITINVTDPGPQAYEIYALRRAWDESQATWQRASSGTNWTTAGAHNTSSDRENIVLGSMNSSSTGIKTFSLNSNGITKVRSWVTNPSSNHEFVIIDYVNNTNGLDFSSSENSTVANRPKLTVTYQ